MNAENSSHIPDHWDETNVGEVAKVNPGNSPPGNSYNKEGKGIPLINGPDEFRDHALDKAKRIKFTTEPTKRCKKGDILLCVRGSTTGRMNIAGFDACIGRGVAAIRSGDRVEQSYLNYFIHSQRQHIFELGSGSTFPSVSTKDVEGISISLPPRPEQRRIVAKIEKLFSNLDAGMADLQAAGQKLERYRLSVLQAAVEGRLTADWRRTHDPEPADQLLERILEEREKKWYKSRYKDPVEPEFGNSFPEAPDGWTVTSFDSVLSHVTSGPRGWSDYYHEGNGVFILAQNVGPGQLDFSETKNVNPPSDASGRDRAMVQKDDLLVTIVGANTGDVCRVGRELDEHWVCQSVALMRPALPATCKYLEIYLNSQLGQRQYERFAYGQGRPHLNFGQLKATPLLLPPLAEQKQIVDEVERLLSVADDAAATADREHTRAERLRQSILKQAFSGRLVPHDEDAAPPAIEASSSNGRGQDSSGDTGSPSDEDSSGEDDLVAEELSNGGDPGKQIEMDL